ncbi:unnamed protein product, partial [Scytosiphon promiscuus]
MIPQDISVHRSRQRATSLFDCPHSGCSAMKRPRRKGVVGAGGGGGGGGSSNRSLAFLVPLLLVDAADSFWATPATTATSGPTTVAPTAFANTNLLKSAGRGSCLCRGSHSTDDRSGILKGTRFEMRSSRAVCGAATWAGSLHGGGYGMAAPSREGSFRAWSTARPMAFIRQQLAAPLMARDFLGEGDGEMNLPSDVDIDQLLLELAGMGDGQRSDDRADEREVEQAGWEGRGEGSSFGEDSGVAASGDAGREGKKWRKKKKKKKRGWDADEFLPPPVESIGDLEKELLGIWDSDGGGGRNANFVKPGDKRGGIGGRRSRGRDGFGRGGGGGGGGGGGESPISRAVSDEDLFESLFGDQRGAGVDIGGGAGQLAVAATLLEGRRRPSTWPRPDADEWIRDQITSTIEEYWQRSEGEEVDVEQKPPPRPTREVFEEAMAELTPELRAMWTELQEVVGSAAAVPILQNIVNATPDGAVQPELFQALFPFELDPFQTEALRALAGRNNVIVSAPTGSGKTVVGELAVYYALALNLRVFYTTPLKALSNQKFQDFRRQFGEEKVGLLTGDSSFNRDAQVAVMTTEVFRNMLYDSEETGDLEDVFAVVFDEFHYMNDRDRGTVWEESVINCPKTVLMVALSATMSNVGEIKDWMQHTHGPSALVVSDFRPVPLSYWFATKDGLYNLFRDPDSGPGAPNGGRRAGEGSGDSGALVRTLSSGFGGKSIPRSLRRKRSRLPSRLRINDELLESHEAELNDAKRDSERNDYDRGSGRSKYGGGGAGGNRGYRGGGGDRRGGKYRGRQESGGGYGGGGDRRDARKSMRNAAYRAVPSFPYLVRCLGRKDLLPAIVFIFSRAGCDQAAKQQVGQDSNALLNVVERRTVEGKLAAFQEANPQVPIPDSWRQLILLGISTHHAGLLPVFKSFVEELFAEALVKVVFATETLAAGINMPARATVITTLSKRIDTGIVKLNPSQLLQMGGRAGRRGKDSSGSVVLMRSRFEDCIEAHRLLLSPMDGIQSQFKSSYGMAVGVLRTRNMESARILVEKSFGNFVRRKRVGPAQ